MTEGKYEHSLYMRELIQTTWLKRIIQESSEFLSDKSFEAIAFSGNSGALLAAPLALALDKGLILVRKPDTECHSDYKVEGLKEASTYIIVDDFVASGSTVEFIRRRVEEWSPSIKLTGVLETFEMLEGREFWHTKFPWGRKD
jgi:adenine/guanine phosphoribosyltransferase-like PRPP-binding protein